MGKSEGIRSKTKGSWFCGLFVFTNQQMNYIITIMFIFHTFILNLISFMKYISRHVSINSFLWWKLCFSILRIFVYFFQCTDTFTAYEILLLKCSVVPLRNVAKSCSTVMILFLDFISVENIFIVLLIVFLYKNI